MTNPPDVKTISRLATEHVNRYAASVARAVAGDDSFVTSECYMYLGIWWAIAAKGCDWSRLNTVERNEVIDAHEDEDDGS